MCVLIEAKRIAPDAITIGIEDSGTGFDLNELYEHYREVAKMKLAMVLANPNSGKISLVDFCLAGDLWREVPPSRILEKPLSRGESFTGGTGLGMDLVRRIVEDGHHGLIVVDKGRRLKGALVESIIPDTPSTDPEARRKITERIVQEKYNNALTEWEKIAQSKGAQGRRELEEIAKIRDAITKMDFEELKSGLASGVLMRIRAFAEESEACLLSGTEDMDLAV